MVIFGKLAKLLLCYKRYVLSHPGLHLPDCDQPISQRIEQRCDVTYVATMKVMPAQSTSQQLLSDSTKTY